MANGIPENRSVKPVDTISSVENSQPEANSNTTKSEPLIEKAVPAKSHTTITDQLLLDTVRDQVYQKLVSGEINLGLSDGFKAIEIKHKIAEGSQNEKLLLEILSEIRSQELAT